MGMLRNMIERLHRDMEALKKQHQSELCGVHRRLKAEAREQQKLHNEECTKLKDEIRRQVIEKHALRQQVERLTKQKLKPKSTCLPLAAKEVSKQTESVIDGIPQTSITSQLDDSDAETQEFQKDELEVENAELEYLALTKTTDVRTTATTTRLMLSEAQRRRLSEDQINRLMHQEVVRNLHKRLQTTVNVQWSQLRAQKGLSDIKAIGWISEANQSGTSVSSSYPGASSSTSPLPSAPQRSQSMQNLAITNSSSAPSSGGKLTKDSSLARLHQKQRKLNKALEVSVLRQSPRYTASPVRASSKNKTSIAAPKRLPGSRAVGKPRKSFPSEGQQCGTSLESSPQISEDDYLAAPTSSRRRSGPSPRKAWECKPSFPVRPAHAGPKHITRQVLRSKEHAGSPPSEGRSPAVFSSRLRQPTWRKPGLAPSASTPVL